MASNGASRLIARRKLEKRLGVKLSAPPGKKRRTKKRRVKKRRRKKARRKKTRRRGRKRR